MPNPQYYRQMNDNKVLGFKRVTTEYLPIDCVMWQLEPIDDNHLEEQKLSTCPKGIGNYPRRTRWSDAIKHLVKIKSKYFALSSESNWFPLGQIRHMEARWDDGERSEQLYKEITSLK